LKEERAIPSKDQRTYDWASRTLRLGMYTSFGAMVIGLIWWLVKSAGGAETSQDKVIPLDRILPELFALNPLALLDLGVVLLLITPGVTLLTQIATFAAAHNWRFAGIATLVAAILLLSLAVSLKWIVLF
jgi:uncharacterized membrane protein